MEPEERFLSGYAPYLEGAAPSRIYGGIDTYSADGLPYIGAYSKKTPNLFVASGYGGRGLIGSMVAAQAISAKILGLPGEGYAVYSGQRHGGVFSDEQQNIGFNRGEIPEGNASRTCAALPAHGLQASVQAKNAYLGMPVSRLAV